MRKKDAGSTKWSKMSPSLEGNQSRLEQEENGEKEILLSSRFHHEGHFILRLLEGEENMNRN